MRIFADAAFRFIQARRKAYVVSGLILIVGIGAMVANVATLGSWQQYGVDFTGGSLVQLRFDGDVTAADLRGALGGVEAPPITRFGSDNEFVVRAPVADDASITEVADNIEAQVREALPDEPFDVVRTELVGSQVGEELQQKAALAILFSFVATLLYLAIRFELRFGVAAVIATLHDIMVTLGFLALFRVEISLTTVAALLTIVGYSLNDTIVVFDRIRENMKMKGARKRDPTDLVNQSINETLPRTVLTSGTTLAVLFCLLVLGGAVIRDFTLVLILGVAIGTYSSVFVASPALIEIQQRWGMGTLGTDKKKKRPQPATV